MPQPNGASLFGHEWVQEGQPYLKVGIAEDGWYKLSAQDIAVAGLPLNASNSNRWELYHQGQAQPIYVGEDGIYFYARKNDGQLPLCFSRSRSTQSGL